VRVLYFTKKTIQELLKLNAGVKYRATFISPLDGKEYPVGEPLATGADGSCDVPHGPVNQDWVLALKPEE
jgi:hypothetical protein